MSKPLSQATIDQLQPALKMMFGHSKRDIVDIDSVKTTTHYDEPLISEGFSICTGVVLLYHNAQGQVEPSLLHISTPYLGREIYPFLQNLASRIEQEGGHVEAVCVTGPNSQGDSMGIDKDAHDIKQAIFEVIPPQHMKFHETIKSHGARSFGLAYVPPTRMHEGLVCVRDYGTSEIVPHMPFDSRGTDVAADKEAGRSGGI